MKKIDVETHRTGYAGPSLPAVNVKVYKSTHDYDDAALAEIAGGDTRFNWAWIDANVPDDDSDWFNAACESGWEMLQEDAREIFGQHVKVWAEGRSGGWAVVEGLADIEEWDAIMLSKWAKFAKFARQAADDIPWQMLSLIYLNDFEYQAAAIDGI